ncbi:MAG: hypothetical protein COS89_03855 [Deltaproteobacteria bacterium CG07_land_8_20_14_0_80_38_7]|nr:MAG: hypothetical protein COS89_03855 [Deltaproteobacteria bacterium CG07_land_8_20_14_0_80_38_7]
MKMLLKKNVLSKKPNGFTLMEYILVIALTSILFLILSQAIAISLRSWDIVSSGTKLIRDTEVGFALMTRDIRQIRDTTSLITANNTELNFIDASGNPIQYRLAGNTLQRNSNVVIDNVDNLLFEFFDANNATIAIPIVGASETNIRTIRVTLTVSPASQSMVVRSTIMPRNVR